MPWGVGTPKHSLNDPCPECSRREKLRHQRDMEYVVEIYALEREAGL